MQAKIDSFPISSSSGNDKYNNHLPTGYEVYMLRDRYIFTLVSTVSLFVLDISQKYFHTQAVLTLADYASMISGIIA